MDVDTEKVRCLDRLSEIVQTEDLPGDIQIRVCQIIALLEDADQFGTAAEHLCMTRAMLVVNHGYSDDDELLLTLTDIEIDLIDIFNSLEDRNYPTD